MSEVRQRHMYGSVNLPPEPEAPAAVETLRPPEVGLRQAPIRVPELPGVRQRACQCSKCAAPTLPGHDPRLAHYYCCVCQRGPLPFAPKGPYFAKSYFQAGGVRGVTHYCCSEPCRISYLAALGVVPGVNDHEPPAATDGESEALPPRHAVAFDSD